LQHIYSMADAKMPDTLLEEPQHAGHLNLKKILTEMASSSYRIGSSNA